MNKFLIIILITMMTLTGCNSVGEGDLIIDNTGNGKLTGTARVPLESLITNISNNVVYPTTKELLSHSSELEESVIEYCKIINEKIELAPGERAALIRSTRVAWKKAMTSYHKLEVMQYGPVKEPLSTTMKTLYTFDTNHKCRAEILVSRKTAPNFSITNEEEYKLVGLDVLEAFLFSKDDESQCPRALPWMEKPLIERQKDICSYISPVATNIKEVSRELEQRWNPKVGDYNGQILVNRVLGAPESAVNKISQALFYLYGGIVDFKVTVPAGIQVSNNRIQSCDKASCPERTEHQKSGHSIESVIAALNGFKAIFFGTNLNDNTNGLGFDDLLNAQGQSATVTQMRNSIDAAIFQLEKHIGGKTLTELATNVDSQKCASSTSTNRTEEICALNYDIKEVTDTLLRSEVLLKGLLARPSSQQGDND